MEVKKTNEQARRIEYRTRVLRLCFDRESIRKFTPGLKLIFASEESPLLVHLDEGGEKGGSKLRP